MQYDRPVNRCKFPGHLHSSPRWFVFYFIYTVLRQIISQTNDASCRSSVSSVNRANIEHNDLHYKTQFVVL